MEEESLQNLLKFNSYVDKRIKNLKESKEYHAKIAEESICFINRYLSLWKIYQSKETNKIYLAFICPYLRDIFLFQYENKKIKLKTQSGINNSMDSLMKFDEFIEDFLPLLKEEKHEHFLYLMFGSSEIKVDEYFPYNVNYLKFDSNKKLFVKLGSDKYSYRKKSICVFTLENDIEYSEYSEYEEDVFVYFYPSDEILKNISKYIETHKRIV